MLRLGAVPEAALGDAACGGLRLQSIGEFARPDMLEAPMERRRQLGQRVQEVVGSDVGLSPGQRREPS